MNPLDVITNMKEYVGRPETEMRTGEAEGVGLTPDERETISEAYEVLTKLIILGNELHDKDLVAASQNLQDIIDEL